MTITLCNSHPFTFYLPFHTSLRADQCPIQSHVPSTCTLGLDPCARHSLFGRTDPYYIDNFYSSCGLKRLAATLASPFSVIVLSSQYLFQRGPIWVIGGWPNPYYKGSINILDVAFRYKSSSMLIHHYMRWSLVYGWMTRLILPHKGILGHFVQKITKKAWFGDFILENLFFVRETPNLLQICPRGCC